MFKGWVIAIAAVGYIGLLFAIAYFADRRADQGRSLVANPYVYSLSLAVYATAWTFYGSVGRAAHDGVGFMPIYIGPTLMIVLWWFIVRKMIRIAKLNRITSLADFIASRYGKSALLGGLVTVIAVLGILPYISLQLKAVSTSFQILVHDLDFVNPPKAAAAMMDDTAFFVALMLAFFTVIFGTRHLDVAERHEGMVTAVAFESLVKLVAFSAVGLFVAFGLFDGLGDLFGQARNDARIAPLLAPFEGPAGSYASWVWLTVLSMLAIVFLPRQFQVAVIENVDEQHLKKAVWLFPLYMLLINIFVLPIAIGGLLLLPHANIDADTFVLTLPMAHQQEWLALLVFIGGLSAATGMVIVETIALSTMVSNELVMPVLLRMKSLRFAEQKDLSHALLVIRRAAIFIILLMGYCYYLLAGEAYALVSIGLISFAAVAQFAPIGIGGMYWKGGTRQGALAGLTVGFAVWMYTLLLPAFAKSGWLAAGFVENGPFGIALLKPAALFGLTGLDQITHAMLWSMIANVGCYVGVSLCTRQSAFEYAQATLFVDVFTQTREIGHAWRGTTSASAMQTLLGRFLGPGRAAASFAAYARERGLKSAAELDADASLVQFAERQLAGAIGAASARTLVATVTQEEPLGLDEVMSILDETSQVIAYSRQLEEKQCELEAATASLKAANLRLQELDRLKDDFISTVTHELRTPLTSIRACSEILADNPDLSVEERQRFLGMVIKESERLTRLINQVLDLAKLEAGMADWHHEELDLREMIRDAVQATAPLFEGRGVRVETHLAEAPERVLADRDRLMQVMLNLLSNAAKFSPAAGGKVTIHVRQEGGELRVDVCDNGAGISDEDQLRIFDKFRQGTAAQAHQGSGLGLAISRHIVRHLGGRLWVESAPGAGAMFSFTLPGMDGGLDGARA